MTEAELRQDNERLRRVNEVMHRTLLNRDAYHESTLVDLNKAYLEIERLKEVVEKLKEKK